MVPRLKKNALVQFPTVMGGVVPIVNIQGIKPGQLVLNGQVLADIYMGKITKWNDPAIAGAEPGREAAGRGDRRGAPLGRLGHDLHLHRLPVEGHADWKDQVGEDTSVAWPTGLGGKGNEGVAAFVGQTAELDRLCRVCLCAAEQADLHRLINAAGKRVAPEVRRVRCRRRRRRLVEQAGFYVILTNQPGDASLADHRRHLHPDAHGRQGTRQPAAALKFFDWAYANGDAEARKLDYVPMPASVVRRSRRNGPRIKGSDGKPV